MDHFRVRLQCSWMRKKQRAVSDGIAETHILSLDAGIRLEAC